MDTTCALQLILPTDKRNPSFTLWRDEAQQTIHVYYGFELMEVVPEDRQHLQYKLLVANLYNAGLKVADLEVVFQVDRKTMRAWGEALRAGDAQRLVQVLSGRQGRRKLTPEIQSFIRHRFAEVYRQYPQKYNTKLRQEVEAVFGVQLSGEAIRPLLGTLRLAPEPQTLTPPAAEPVGMPEVSTAPGLGWESPSPEEHPLVRGEGDATLGQEGAEVSEEKMGETSCEGQAEAKLRESLARKLSPDFEPWIAGQTRWCDHLGVRLFGEALAQVGAVGRPSEPLLKQWLASVLLGAVNVEQTKYLNWDDLSLLLGTVVRFPSPQREALTRMARTEMVPALLRWNAQQVGAETQSDFYLDPHTKHYTGQSPILKGWCPAIRWADKALHSDFVHTAGGEPVYFECTDNFADLRERFWGVVERMRQTLRWPPDKVLTLIIDRGVFSLEVFDQIRADPRLRLITWEKGYEAGQWSAEKKAESSSSSGRATAPRICGPIGSNIWSGPGSRMRRCGN